VEKLTPPETVDPSERREILKDLAKALKKQGSFTLASKKYTQAGLSQIILPSSLAAQYSCY
jgi:isopenicillin N synthase-like dioxygenase